MKYISTKNLDLAAYLMSKGYEPTTTYIHTTLASYKFHYSLRLAFYRFLYLHGHARANIHTFLYCRTHLKKDAQKQGISCSKVIPSQTNTELQHLIARPYWYLDNGIIYHAIFGKDIIHEQRYRSGNFYESKHEANRAMNNRP